MHSLANGPEVTKALLDTSRKGYLAASSASAYSYISLLSALGPLMNPGGAAMSLTYAASESVIPSGMKLSPPPLSSLRYIASENVIPGYGGGMSSAKAALESDTRETAVSTSKATMWSWPCRRMYLSGQRMLR